MRKSKSAIILVLTLVIVLVLLNLIFFVDPRQAEETEAEADRSSYRTTPYGTHAFYTLLNESGYPVTRFEKPLTEIKHSDLGTLVAIALPAHANPSEEEIKSLNEWVEAGGLLVIIDRDILISFGDINIHTTPGYSRAVRTLKQTPYSAGVKRLALSEVATRAIITDTPLASPPAYSIGDDHGAVLADVKVGQGRVVVLTDPYVVANNGIADADNVIAALNLFAERPSGKIAFDEYHHGHGATTEVGGVLAYFRGTPVPWMLAQAALVGILVIYSYGRRLARPVPLRRERRTTNLEFVSSMANISRLARATDLAMQNVYHEFRKRLCRFNNLPATADNRRLAEATARRARLRAAELAALLAKCESVARGERVTDVELLGLVTRVREIESRLGF